MKPVPVRKEFMFRRFCQDLTSDSRDMIAWLQHEVQDTFLICRYGWDNSNLDPEVKA